MKTTTSILIAGAMVAAAIYFGITRLVPIPSVVDCGVAFRDELKGRYGVSLSPSPNCYYHWLQPASKETQP